MPLCTLLGGNHQDDILLYRAISQGTPHEMAALVQKYKSMVCIILLVFKQFCYFTYKALEYIGNLLLKLIRAFIR